MTEIKSGTGKHTAEATTQVETDETKRPRRKFVSFTNDDETARLRITPRFKRNAARVGAIAAVAVISPPMAAATALVGSYQAWTDQSEHHPAITTE